MKHRTPHNRPLQVRRTGIEESPWEDIYHRLLRMSWMRFFAYFLLVYVMINGLFATMYYMVPGSIAHIEPGDFFDCFAFAVQTMSTVGYGYFYPQTHFANMIVTVQTGAGLYFTAVLTGLVFAKFSHPRARVVFSDHILWTAQNGQPVLSLRLGNLRTNRVFEGHARLTLLRDELTSEGERLRRMVDLKLLRHQTPLFALSWTIFHVIDANSPLHGMTPEKMAELGWEVYVTFNGLDEDMERTIVAHSTYSASQILRARKFVDMIHVDQGVRVIDFSKLHDIEQ